MQIVRSMNTLPAIYIENLRLPIVLVLIQRSVRSDTLLWTQYVIPAIGR